MVGVVVLPAVIGDFTGGMAKGTALTEVIDHFDDQKEDKKDGSDQFTVTHSSGRDNHQDLMDEDYLEKELIKKLKAKFEVNVNEDVLTSMIKE